MTPEYENVKHFGDTGQYERIVAFCSIFGTPQEQIFDKISLTTRAQVEQFIMREVAATIARYF